MPSNSYERVCLLHSNAGNRHFCGLFFEANKDITFYIVNPVANKQQNQHKAVNFKSIFVQTLTESLSED